VKIGHGRDYDDVPPLRGLYSGTAVPHVDSSVEIRRMDATRVPISVQPPTPRVVESRRRQEAAQQQQ
jgi:hypothetical protein